MQFNHFKEEKKYKLEIVEKTDSNGNNLTNNLNNLTIKVWEMRKVKGVFYEHLELYEFPMDVQEVSITIASKLSEDQVELVENKKEACSINTEDFLDCQEWNIYDHVNTKHKALHDHLEKFNRSALKVNHKHIFIYIILISSICPRWTSIEPTTESN